MHYSVIYLIVSKLQIEFVVFVTDVEPYQYFLLIGISIESYCSFVPFPLSKSNCVRVCVCERERESVCLVVFSPKYKNDNSF